MSLLRAKSDVKRYERQSLLDLLKTQGKTAITHFKPFFSWQWQRNHAISNGKGRLRLFVRAYVYKRKNVFVLLQPVLRLTKRYVLQFLTIQLRSLTLVKVSTGISQLLQSRSKAETKWRAWTESQTWGQRSCSFIFPSSEKTYAETSTNLTCKSCCWRHNTFRSS